MNFFDFGVHCAVGLQSGYGSWCLMVDWELMRKQLEQRLRPVVLEHQVNSWSNSHNKIPSFPSESCRYLFDHFPQSNFCTKWLIKNRFVSYYFFSSIIFHLCLLKLLKDEYKCKSSYGWRKQKACKENDQFMNNYCRCYIKLGNKAEFWTVISVLVNYVEICCNFVYLFWPLWISEI